MPSSVKVLLLVENNAFPFDVRVRREAHALRDAGFQVSVISPRGSNQPWSEQIDGIRVYRFPAPPGGNGIFGYAFEFGYTTLAMLLLAVWVALRHGVDVIHAANPPDTLFMVGSVFKLFGKRYVFDHHDLSPETYLSRFGKHHPDFVYSTLRILERCSYSVADIVIATNESYKAIALSRGRKKPSEVFVVRNGPPLSYYAENPDPGLAQRAEFLVGYIGTMGPQDGVDYWLRAVHEMVHKLGRRDFLAVIIGSGDALSDLQVLAKDLKIESYVWFTGRIPDLEARTYLSTVHVCVHPDPMSPLNDKSTMNKMMEYMALAKPVVTFDLKEARFSAQEAASYVQPNNEREFAERVCWLFDHPAERTRMGEIGRHRVSSVLAWEYSVPNLLRAYCDGLGLCPQGQISSRELSG